jgi:hypothetical protein
MRCIARFRPVAFASRAAPAAWTGAVLLLALHAMPAHAQNTDAQIWTGANANFTLNDHTEAGIESILRVSDSKEGLYEAELGVSMTWKVAKGIKLQIAYVQVPSYSESGVITRREYRPRQQIAFGNIASFWGGTLSGRMRVEERFVSTSDEMGVRLRPQIKYVLPFRTGHKTALVLYDESFIPVNDTDWGQNAGFDRMRNFVGITTPLAKKIDIEMGYLNQYIFGKDGKRDEMDHVASLTLNFAI